MNPRYLAYAAAHGQSPEGMLALDAERFPGGRMAGYLIWVSQRASEYRRARGLSHYGIIDHDDLTAYMTSGSPQDSHREEHADESSNREGPPGTYGCACVNTDARLCYLIRYDVDPADDSLDDGRCECLCHHWREDTR